MFFLFFCVFSSFSQSAKALWFDRKKYVTINFMIQKPKDVQVDIQDTKMILRWEIAYFNHSYFIIKTYL